jgi:hypothetical protein
VAEAASVRSARKKASGGERAAAAAAPASSKEQAAAVEEQDATMVGKEPQIYCEAEPELPKNETDPYSQSVIVRVKGQTVYSVVAMKLLKRRNEKRNKDNRQLCHAVAKNP